MVNTPKRPKSKRSKRSKKSKKPTLPRLPYRGIRATPIVGTGAKMLAFNRLVKTVSRTAARSVGADRRSALKNVFFRGGYVKRHNSPGKRDNSYTAKLLAVAGRGDKPLNRRFVAERNARIDFMPAAKRFSKQSLQQQANCIRMVTAPVAVGWDADGNRQEVRTLNIGRETLAKRAAYAGLTTHAHAWREGELIARHKLKPGYALTVKPGKLAIRVNRERLAEYIEAKRAALKGVPIVRKKSRRGRSKKGKASRSRSKGKKSEAPVEAAKADLAEKVKVAKQASKKAVGTAVKAAVAIVAADPLSSAAVAGAKGLVAAAERVDAAPEPRRSMRVRGKGT
jgi:hypothetical protein